MQILFVSPGGWYRDLLLLSTHSYGFIKCSDIRFDICLFFHFVFNLYLQLPLLPLHAKRKG